MEFVEPAPGESVLVGLTCRLRESYNAVTTARGAMSLYLSPQFKAFHGVTGVVLDRSGLKRV